MDNEIESQPQELDFDSLDLSSIKPELAPPSGHNESESCATPQPRRKFDPSLGERRRETQARVNQSLDELRRTLGSDFRLVGAVRVSLKGRPGGATVFNALIDCILSAKGATQSQTDIREEVQARHPNSAVPKDWNVSLSRWAIKRLQTRIWGSGPPVDSIRTTSKTTLGSLHRSAKLAWQRHQTGTVRLKAEISISDDTLFINGQPFAISQNMAKGRSYPFARVSIPKLLNSVR